MNKSNSDKNDQKPLTEKRQDAIMDTSAEQSQPANIIKRGKNKMSKTQIKTVNNSAEVTAEVVDDNSATTREKFLQLERELNTVAFERQDVIRGSILAVLTRTNLLQLGAPGAAKSYITKKLAQSLNCAFFHYLLGKNTTPDELFGPVSLQGLRQDKYLRVTTGKAPEAHIYFADEIFKGSSAVINANLTLINEHEFDSGYGMKPVPLITCFGASNELPESNSGLDAMYDRFALKFWVDYISDNQNFSDMLTNNIGEVTTTIDLSELETSQEEVSNIVITAETVKAMIQIKTDLEANNIIASDRRYKEATKLIRASAWLAGRNKTSVSDVRILADILWHTPEQIERVRLVVKKHSMNAEVFRGEELMSDLRKLAIEAKTGDDSVFYGAIGNLKETVADMKQLYIKTGGTISEGASGLIYSGGNDEIEQFCHEIRSIKNGLDVIGANKKR